MLITVFTLWLTILLLCSGDIHPNPGPSSIASSLNSSTSHNQSNNSLRSLNLSHNLSFVHYNVQSILNKLYILEAELFEFDILAFTATWLNPTVQSDARVRNIISKGPKYRFASNIDFSKCRREIAASLNDFSNRWCKRENVEPDALKEWKINIFKIIDTRISFYSRNTHLLPPKPKSSFSHLKRGIQDFHMNYVLVPADKAANNVVVV